jgi:hypothetical protein
MKMVAESRPPRLLLAAEPPEGAALRRLLLAGPARGWEVVEAGSLGEARFIMHFAPCNPLLVDEGLFVREGETALGGAEPSPAWVILLADLPPEVLARVWQRGIHQWLPRRLALTHPNLLAGALSQAARAVEIRGRWRQAEAALRECRRRRDRLVDLIWRASPAEPRTGWLPQRPLLERLEEEIVRSRRYGGALAVALGEVLPPADAGEGNEALSDWAAGQVARGKRRCDVAGSYGPHGFFLLMSQTPAAAAAIGCRRLQRLLEAGRCPPGCRGPRGPTSASPPCRTTPPPPRLLATAEERLEQAKGDGVGPIVD